LQRFSSQISSLRMSRRQPHRCWAVFWQPLSLGASVKANLAFKFRSRWPSWLLVTHLDINPQNIVVAREGYLYISLPSKSTLSNQWCETLHGWLADDIADLVEYSSILPVHWEKWTLLNEDSTFVAFLKDFADWRIKTESRDRTFQTAIGR
jgi:hypothetical protein